MEIVHDEKENRFYLKKDGKVYNLNYRKLHEKLWDFIDSSEEEEMDCCGVLEELTEEAMKYIQEHEIKILANCCSVQDYLIKNKGYRNLIYTPY